jgi:hypothetical protein
MLYIFKYIAPRSLLFLDKSPFFADFIKYLKTKTALNVNASSHSLACP